MRKGGDKSEKMRASNSCWAVKMSHKGDSSVSNHQLPRIFMRQRPTTSDPQCHGKGRSTDTSMILQSLIDRGGHGRAGGYRWCEQRSPNDMVL